MMVPDGESIGGESHFLHANISAAEKLERARTELLDLSARNRLLNIPRAAKSAKLVEVVDEKSVEVFRMLVTEGRAFTFLAGKAASIADTEAGADEISDLAQPDESVNEHGVLNRHVDTKLQTRLTSKGLQKRLLELYFDARTLEEEQGVNTLYLALGTLRWVDPTSAKNRYAPLILIPVNLERGNAAEQFKLRWRQEEIASNLSLEAYLERVHSLKMPSFDAGDELDIKAYLHAVTDVVKSKSDWEVVADDIVLGLFSFSKFLMYRDLDPTVWPLEGGLTAQPLISGLLNSGFEIQNELLSEDVSIDAHISPADMLHIVDCDSSQALAVHDARAGQNLVIQGPPGTGKSQTIANIIASAIADGKTVLFVAEKMAALEVVKRRLDYAGVGDACLELHSNKANKRILLEELKRTAALGAPRGDFESTLNYRLLTARDALNSHAARLHRRHGASGLTPYQVIGELARLKQEDVQPVEIKLDRPETWSADDRMVRERLIGELAQRVIEIGPPLAHPWNGVGLTVILPTDVDRLTRKVTELKSRIDEMQSHRTSLAGSLGLAPPGALGSISSLIDSARWVSVAPELTGQALASQSWDAGIVPFNKLLDAGVELAGLSAQLSDSIHPEAWKANVDVLRGEVAQLPNGFDSEMFSRAAELNLLVPSLVLEIGRLMISLGLSEGLDTIADVHKKIRTAERVAAAPDVSSEVLVATVWDHGVEQAAELAGAVASWEVIKTDLEGQVVDAAYEMDFSASRQALAVHGGSFFRFLSGDWRKANSQVKSILKVPDLPLPAQLDVLDKLGKGARAVAAIRHGEEFGRAAFGNDWRGERSTAAPLNSLVEWMRSLRGLGAEPRVIAGSLPDRSAIGERASHVHRLVGEVSTLLRPVWEALAEKRNELFPGVLNYENASLKTLQREVAKLAEMREFFDTLFMRLPTSPREIQSLLDNLIAAQTARQIVDDSDSFAQPAYDTAWKGASSDWEFLKTATRWVGANSEFRKIVANHEQRAAALEQANRLNNDVTQLIVDLGSLFGDLCSDSEKLFGWSKIADLEVPALTDRLSVWIDGYEQLSKWVAYRDRVEQANALGLQALVAEIESGAVKPESATRTFDMAYYEALFRDQASNDPALSRFDGQIHSRVVAEFAALDRERISAASLEVVRAHHRRIPQGGGGAGPLGVLRGEMARRRGHMPIRQLMLKAAPAIQALKPVLMMSPLSVAQFLPPGHLTFDMLVMDEASQIQPVDAFGAIARCRQVVVVGDERQLPPTKFFSKMTGGSQDDEEADEAQVADIESILGLFTARGLPQRMLRWHYRSRHQSLIAVSNSQFYENKLFIVPSPYTREAGMGLQFSYIPDGIFDSGNTGVNVIEARVVAEAIIRHAKESPGRSLGVATFSVKQRTAIQDQLELLRRANPDAEAFFNGHPNEPFFVKNLENVQGDERDIIFISVGYGRNPQGYMAMRFGPLSADGGERRLNVLISRAKRRCEVFASITDEDIDLERGKGKGVFAFKLFLHFARTGRLGITQTTERQYESSFEIQVGKALQRHGYQVHPQVGISGFFIDLAIADPEHAGRYLLGIECDGASYHNSRSARDRDRLRQAVLEDHGWIIHRIWSTDWFNRPNDELQRLLAAADRAKAELGERMERSLKPGRAVPVSVVTVERGDVTEIGLVPTNEDEKAGNVYVEASLICPNDKCELHDTPIPVLADLIRSIVAVESPVHADEIVVRLRTIWGLKRAGGRIQATVERALEAALHNEGMVMQNRFVSKLGAPIIVRDRSHVQSDALRKPEMLPPAEIDTAIDDIVRSNFGARPTEIVQAVSRSFGFKATSGQLRDVIQARVDSMVATGSLVKYGDNLVLVD